MQKGAVDIISADLSADEYVQTEEEQGPVELEIEQWQGQPREDATWESFGPAATTP